MGGWVSASPAWTINPDLHSRRLHGTKPPDTHNLRFQAGCLLLGLSPAPCLSVQLLGPMFLTTGLLQQPWALVTLQLHFSPLATLAVTQGVPPVCHTLRLHGSHPSSVTQSSFPTVALINLLCGVPCPFALWCPSQHTILHGRGHPAPLIGARRCYLTVGAEGFSQAQRVLGC